MWKILINPINLLAVELDFSLVKNEIDINVILRPIPDVFFEQVYRE